VNILYLSEGGHTCDYLRDCCFHGFRSLLGPSVVDYPRIETMYQGYDTSKLYGKGFTLYGLLPDVEVDRDDIPAKIAHKYFDLVVYGSIHRNHDYLHEVSSMYPPERVIFLDGEDHPGYLKGLGGMYFKRELHNPIPGVWPIQFSIPKEKILKEPPQKTRLMAPMDPIDSTTYIYKDEASYYHQYAESCFGYTMKKAGWDCLRHYEIMSQWCIPCFRCLDECPYSIMVNFPRTELALIHDMYQYFWPRGLAHGMLENLWGFLIEPVMKVLREHLTTEAMAEYILNTVGVRRKEFACS
jgi:ferredoxin